ncbi:MAG: orotidine-5'-phosphate decarboxylase [Candidatus Aminicenantes bacterium]|nr:orotidine-5'-phosphate decarboxylase [Candidatus Aminicenantes bacterium]MDH5384430.1 orotidine-5'-phosphate decarboxylase [Candidatus Aminicenantes bacterium]MDH5744802.1 orotidine-5'-phosphate decarboxylase [Candidatus Aminicenantes bacterium]
MEREKGLSKKIIVALDVNTKQEALSLVKELPAAEIFKVGLRLFTAEGPSLLQEIRKLGKKIFLDLKLHDIPDQVAGAVMSGVSHGVHMMTLHASGGKEMMAAAILAASQEARKRGKSKPLLLAVTILTSLKDDQLRDIGMEDRVLAQVLRLAGLSKEEGMDGVVCSPQEIDSIKKEFGEELLVVSPGIRPVWAAAQDQKRILTPLEALQKGVDYMVIGRPIIRAPSPSEAFSKIMEELNRAVDASNGKNGT